MIGTAFAGPGFDLAAWLDLAGVIWGWVRDLGALAFFAAAFVFGTAGVWGLYRFPDPWSRLQASSLAGTTAVFSLCAGALLLAPTWDFAARIGLILAFFLVSSPTGAHIVGRFTWNSGLKPWAPKEKDGDREGRP